MRKVALSSIGALVLTLSIGPAAEAYQRPSGGSPATVECYASATGAVGATGPTGATGVQGPQGASPSAPNGPVRSVHVAGKVPNCADISGICLQSVIEGPLGLVGGTGATGPQGDTGFFTGVPRSIHIRQLPCEGVPRGCQYGLAGPQGATGEIGATGPQGIRGVEGGAGRKAHLRPRPYPVSDAVITIYGCDLPETGGRATSFLPYALVLLALGGVVVLATDGRRRRAQA